MKKMMMVAILLIASVFSFGQATPVVNKTTVTSSNPIKMVYEKDQYTDKEYLFTNKDLVLSKDEKTGLLLMVSFKKSEGKWIYNGFTVKSVGVGSSCVENDKLYFLFDDGTKEQYGSWQSFNCKGTSYFDRSMNPQLLNKSIQGVKFVNGRSFDSYEITLTNPDQKNYFVNVIKALEEFNNK